MKLTTTSAQPKESTIEVKEHFTLVDGVPCIDYVVGGYLVARQVIEQQPVGVAFRLINKVYTLSEFVEYTKAEDVDVSKITPDVAAHKGFVGTAVPEKGKSAKKEI